MDWQLPLLVLNTSCIENRVLQLLDYCQMTSILRPLKLQPQVLRKTMMFHQFVVAKQEILPCLHCCGGERREGGEIARFFCGVRSSRALFFLNGFPICFLANANMRRSAFLLHPKETYEYKGFFPVLCVTSAPTGSLNILTTFVISPLSKESEPIASSTCVYEER